jgi:hypothetical protein
MPAVSQKQRGFLAHKFGPEWMKQHHFDNPGKLPKYKHGKKKKEESEVVDEKAEADKREVTSDKQRAFLNARKGHAWVKRHFKKGGGGEKPTYAHGGKTTSPEVKAAFKKKTEETSTTMNVGSTEVGSIKKPKKKKKFRINYAEEMAAARASVMEKVLALEAERDIKRAIAHELV